MKRVISLLLSITMLISTLTCADLSAYAGSFDDAVHIVDTRVSSFLNSITDKLFGISDIIGRIKPITLATTVTSGDYTYTLDSNGNATITKYLGSATSITIPSSIDGHPVTTLGARILNGNQTVKSVIIPKTITTVKKSSSKCSNNSSSSHFGGPFCGSAVQTATIENGTTNIPDCLFFQSENLVSFSIPNTVTEIGDEVFSYCSNLTGISIPDSVTKIGDSAFGYTTISELELPSSLTDLGAKILDGNQNVKSITIPKTLNKASTRNSKCSIQSTTHSGGPFCGSAVQTATIENGTITIPANLFKSNENLESVSIPNTVTEIASSAFNDCKSLSQVSLPKYLASIGFYAFRNCVSITQINLPKSLTDIDTYGYNYYYPFSGCEGLKSIDFEEGITSIPYGIFGNIGIENLVVPETVTEIKEAAFAECSQLRKVDLPYTLTKISIRAFAYCTNLNDVQLPRYLVELGAYAFGGCTSLTTINLPKNLRTIGYYDGGTSTTAYPFRNCTSLETFTYDDGVTNIPENIFRNSGLKSIEIPNTIETIGNSAFRSCTNLVDVKFEDGITRIDDYAFAYTGLTEISLPDTINSMATYIFFSCPNLSKVKLPNIRINLTEGTFKNCVSLKSIDLPDTVEYIRESAFEGSGISSIKLPSNVQVIESSAFKDSALETIEFSSKETSVGSYAFQNCDKLFSISLPDSVKSLGTYIFQDCDILTDVELGIGITEIPSYSFSHCDALERILLPRNVKSIYSNAFSNCVSFTEITIPKFTTAISSTAFSYLDKITINCVPGSYAETFAKNNNIKYVNYELHAQSLELSDDSLTLEVKQKKNIVCNVSPKNFTDDLIFESSNTNVATVDSNGLVTAVSGGTTTITVTAGNVVEECIVNVFELIDYISLNQFSLSIEKGETYKLIAQISPETATNQNLQWSSSDNSVATVDNEGNVTALSEGKTVITVNAMDGSGASSTCSVSVYDNSIKEIVHTVESVGDLESEHNYSNNCFESWVYTLPGVNSLCVVFDERTYVESDYDYICIFDKDETLVGKYTGDELSGKSVTVPGNTVKIRLESDSSTTKWGFKVTSVIDGSHVHEYDLVFTLNSTCTEDGYKKYSCQCGNEMIEIISALGHNYISDTTPPTCSKQGYTTYTCSRCSDEYVYDYVSATGKHNYKTTTAKATLSKNGSVLTKCSVCGSTKSNTTIYYPKTISLSATSYTYDGKVKTPSVKVIGSNGKAISSSNYTVSYASGRKNVGKYTVKITFKGNYSGSKTLYFTINPKGTSISKITAAKKGFKVYWKKQSTQTTGYQIQYSTSSKFSNAKTVTLTKNSYTSKLISKLSAKKKYYVRVRTYKKVGSTYYYSSWSKAKYVTTKK